MEDMLTSSERKLILCIEAIFESPSLVCPLCDRADHIAGGCGIKHSDFGWRYPVGFCGPSLAGTGLWTRHNTLRAVIIVT